MVEVGGTTFRIERVEDFVYEVFRIGDDASVGAFRTEPLLAIVRTDIEPAFMSAIARAAVRAGKTSWARRLPPA
jgi:hypothetical protein